MFWLGLLLSVCYVPGFVGASIPTQWVVLSAILPAFLWSRSLPPTLGHKLFFIWIIYALASLAWSLNWHSAGWGLWLLFIWALSFHYGSLYHDLRPLWKGLAIGLSFGTAVAIAQAADWSLVELADPLRPAGLLFNSSLFGICLGLVLVSLVAHRLWWFIPIPTLGLVLSGSRGGVVVLAIGLIANWSKTAAIATVAAGACLFAWSLDPSDSQRLQIWGVALQALTPFGHGPGSFLDLHYAYAAKSVVIHPEFAHNDLLQLAYEFGIGAIAPYAILGLAIATCRGPAWPTLFAFLVASLFFFPLYSPLPAFIGFVVAGHSLRAWSLARGLGFRRRYEFLQRLAPWRPSFGLRSRQALPVLLRTPQKEG